MLPQGRAGCDRRRAGILFAACHLDYER